MKNKRMFLLIMVTFVLCLTGCSKNEKEIKYEEINRMASNSEIFSCLEEKVSGYIASEDSELKDIELSDLINKSGGITKFKGEYTDNDNRYVIVELNPSYELDVIKEFDLYFSNKYEKYLSYNINGVYIYVSNYNDTKLDELKKCSVSDTNKIKAKKMDTKVVKKLDKTEKIIIKYGGREIGVIDSKDKIKEIIDIVSNSKMYGTDTTLDLHAYEFEMYNIKNKLIDNILVWQDGVRLQPESLESSDGRYIVSSSDKNFREIIEEETDLIFFRIFDYDEEGNEKKELIYEDDDFYYYLRGKSSDKVIIKFESSHLNMTLKYALENNYITTDKLGAYNDIILSVPKEM